MGKLLIIDDDFYFRPFLRRILDKLCEIEESDNEQEAKKLLLENHYEIALIDINLHGHNEGLNLLDICKKKNIFSIILTDYDCTSFIKEAYSRGANHYLTKSDCQLVLEYIVKQQLEKKSKLNFDYIFSEIFITQNEYLKKEIGSLLERMVHGRPILILGESGTGKGVLAHLIHNQISSVREKNKNKFIDINVSAIHESLAESELFGHEKGSFTGATERKMGKLELADGGTLFLDEIGSASMSVQLKLLKAIEDKTFFAVGGNKTIQSDFQLITATSDNLYQKVNDHLFRPDLFYRINSTAIELLPLRQRKEDIPLLVEKFLKNSSRRVFIDDSAMKFLVEYPWPGNIRQLKSVIDNCLFKSDGIILKEDLPISMSKTNNLVNSDKKNILTLEQMELIQKLGLRIFLDKLEKEAIKESMRICHDKVYKAASHLKISKTNMYRLLKKEGSYGL